MKLKTYIEVLEEKIKNDFNINFMYKVKNKMTFKHARILLEILKKKI